MALLMKYINLFWSVVVWRTHLVVLRAYFQLCAQGLLLESSEGCMGCQELNCYIKASVLPAIPTLWLLH